MKSKSNRHLSRRAIISRRAERICEPLESRMLFSAGFIYTAGDFGPHNEGGTINRFTPSGTSPQSFQFNVTPGPAGIVVAGSDLFVLSGDAFPAGGPSRPGEIGEYTTSGVTINANLIPNLDNAQGLAVSGGNIFVTVGNNVAQYTTAGVLVNADLIPGLNGPFALAISGSDLFVESTESGAGTIGQYTLAGSAVNPSLISGINQPISFNSMAIIGSNIFVRTANGVAEYTTAGALVNPTLIADTAADNIGTDGSDLFLQNGSAIGEYSTAGNLVNTIPGIDSPLIAVAPAAPSNAAGLHLNFDVQPFGSNLASPAEVSPDITVSLVDQAGELASNATGSVTLSIASGPVGATLTGTTTEPLVDGAAVFGGFSLSQPGTYTFKASDGTDLAGISASGTIADTHVQSLLFANQPVDLASDQNPINSITVNAADQYENVDQSNTGFVTLSIASGPAGAVLGGTTQALLSSGSVVFSGLTVNRPGIYTLQASEDTALVGSSASFVVFGSPAQLALTSSAASFAIGQPITFTATFTPQASNEPAPTGTVNFTDSAGDLLGTATLQSDGTAVFSTAFIQPVSHTVTATYGGDNTYAPATSSAAVAAPAIPASSIVPTFSRFVVPASSVAGAKFKSHLALTLSNAGATLKGVFTVKLYAQPVAGPDGSQTLLVTMKKSLTIKQSKMQTLTVPFTSLPASLAAGNYNLIAEITDPSGANGSVTAATAVQVVAPVVTPVLTVSVVSPAAIVPGKFGTVFVTIANQGNIIAKGVQASIVASDLNIITLQLGHTSQPRLSISPGKSAKLKFRFKIARDAVAGEYTIAVRATLGGVTVNVEDPNAFSIA